MTAVTISNFDGTDEEKVKVWKYIEQADTDFWNSIIILGEVYYTKLTNNMMVTKRELEVSVMLSNAEKALILNTDKDPDLSLLKTGFNPSLDSPFLELRLIYLMNLINVHLTEREQQDEWRNHSHRLVTTFKKILELLEKPGLCQIKSILIDFKAAIGRLDQGNGVPDPYILNKFGIVEIPNTPFINESYFVIMRTRNPLLLYATALKQPTILYCTDDEDKLFQSIKLIWSKNIPFAVGVKQKMYVKKIRNHNCTRDEDIRIIFCTFDATYDLLKKGDEYTLYLDSPDLTTGLIDILAMMPKRTIFISPNLPNNVDPLIEYYRQQHKKDTVFNVPVVNKFASNTFVKAFDQADKDSIRQQPIHRSIMVIGNQITNLTDTKIAGDQRCTDKLRLLKQPSEQTSAV
jgi:hypothetical protein